MNGSDQLVVFTLAGRQFAIALQSVDQATRMVEVLPLPGVPETVIGIINVRGEIIPVLNLRRRFQLSEKEITTSDHLLIARSSRRKVALVVDAVEGIRERGGQSLIGAEDILPHLDLIEGVMKFDDGMILIHNLDRFLSLDEEVALDRSLKTHEAN